MARKSTKSRRRQISPPPKITPVRRRRRSFGGGRGGFINRELLVTGAGVAGGLLLTPYLNRFIPQQVKAIPYGVPMAKVAAGLGTYYFLKGRNRSIGLALGAGMIASGITDVVGSFMQGKSAGVAGYDLEGYQLDGMPVTLALPDGSEVTAFDQGDGTAVDGLGMMYELEAA